MRTRYIAALAAAIFLLYVSAVFVGMHIHSLAMPSAWTFDPAPVHSSSWRLASPRELTADQQAAIAYGRQLFTETPVYAASYTVSRIACSNCHLQAGTAPFAFPVVGSARTFPQYSKRAARSITLEDRIQECMTRSENGKPLPSASREMHAMLAYINWLSEPHPQQASIQGRGLAMLPSLTPDTTHGAQIYTAQCAGCHGTHGEGVSRPFPPLWGPTAFNDGAGMDRLEKLAAFIHTNMPQNRKGILSAQDAFDVAAYVQQQPRPAFNHAYDHF